MSTRFTATGLLIVSAAVEASAGIALLTLPGIFVGLLIGGSLDAAGALVVARLAGVALLALGLACWLARNDAASRAGKGVIAAMLMYNGGAVAVLAFASLGQGMSGPGLWPAAVLHAGLASWCFLSLQPAVGPD